ncbi:trypsin-like serine protease [Streptomyces sp. V4-01]|uniref:Trypsin-like serine protease n=1 Tax=Actinacidiphila polyblastidii TaxID=3110430 RepID=A0ABU7P4D7_9ACTN|nr:trypsin-like serine protease [Streptomyces sp. V4-01]
MIRFNRGWTRRARAAAPLTALAVGAASLILSAPAHADATGSAVAAGDAQLRAKAQQAAAHLTLGGGTVTPHIIGGSTTNINSAPWMVQLWYFNEDGTANFCGGTLVAQNKVLTAGHCVSGADWVDNGLVVADTGVLGGTDVSPVETIRSQWLHPSYDGTAYDNDVALLTLDHPLNLKTLPLASPNDAALYQPGVQATVYGWGVTDSAPGSQNLAQTLQHLALPLNSDANCADELDGAIGGDAFVAGHMICGGAGGTGDDTTGKTTCSGDSGGPLVVGGRIVGVVSWGVSDDAQDCNVPGTYDVFTKVSSYRGVVQPRIDNTDISRDGRADVLARTPAGASYAYASTGAGVASRAAAPVPLTNYDTVVQADLERDGYQDYILRATSSGNVFMGHRTADRASYSYTQIGSNWKTVKAIVVPGDVTGDGIPDLLTEDSAGRVWVYSGKGNGLFNTAVLSGASWSRYNLVVGHGDYTGDGVADVLGRDSATGGLYVLPGTGSASAPFAAPVLVGTGFNGFDKLVSAGDFTGDGRADLLARTPSGTLFLYAGTGKAGTAAFATWQKIGTGWNMYNLLG